MSKNKTKVTAVPGKQEVVIEREFNAPRELVFNAYTDPKIFVKWHGPKALKMTLEKFEPKSGGSYRFIHTDPKGNKFAFHGVYHEVLKPERIIDTFEYEGLPETGHVILETLRLEELPGNRSKLISQSVYQSVEDRDGMVAYGMEKGVSEGFELLDEILAKARG